MSRNISHFGFRELYPVPVCCWSAYERSPIQREAYDHLCNQYRAWLHSTHRCGQSGRSNRAIEIAIEEVAGMEVLFGLARIFLDPIPLAIWSVVIALTIF